MSTDNNIDLKNISRGKVSVPKKESYSHEEFQTSAMLRMADSAELMAVSYKELINDRDKYKRWYEKERENSDRLKNVARGLRATNTRLKNKLKAYE